MICYADQVSHRKVRNPYLHTYSGLGGQRFDDFLFTLFVFSFSYKSMGMKSAMAASSMTFSFIVLEKVKDIVFYQSPCGLWIEVLNCNTFLYYILGLHIICLTWYVIHPCVSYDFPGKSHKLRSQWQSALRS